MSLNMHACVCVCVLRRFGTKILLTLYRWAQFQMILVKKQTVTNVLNFTNWKIFDQTSVPLITTPKKKINPTWDETEKRTWQLRCEAGMLRLGRSNKKSSIPLKRATTNIVGTFSLHDDLDNEPSEWNMNPSKTYFFGLVELHTIGLKQLPPPRYFRVELTDFIIMLASAPASLASL